MRWSVAVKKERNATAHGVFKGVQLPSLFFCRSPSTRFILSSKKDRRTCDSPSRCLLFFFPPFRCPSFGQQELFVDLRAITPYYTIHTHTHISTYLYRKLSIMKVRRKIPNPQYISYVKEKLTKRKSVHISLRPPPCPRPRLPNTAATSQRHRQQSSAQILMSSQRAGFLLRFQHSLGL